MTTPVRDLKPGQTIIYAEGKSGEIIFKRIGRTVVQLVIERPTGGEIVVIYQNKNVMVKILEEVEG